MLLTYYAYIICIFCHFKWMHFYVNYNKNVIRQNRSSLKTFHSFTSYNGLSIVVMP